MKMETKDNMIRLSEKIDRLDAKFDILNHRVFEQEADIQLLKKTKQHQKSPH